MRTYDLSPLFRSTVGFDHMNRLIATATNNEVATYPPYNIEKSSDDDYRVTMAVAGFSVDNLEITQKENALFIKGKITAENDEITYEAYVSEQNLLVDDSEEPIKHPLINEIFSGRKGSSYFKPSN